MVQLMQLAVICRRNDCRPWRLVNHTEDPFFTELANEMREDAGVRSIKDLINSVDARMNTRNVRPSEFRVLFRAIITKCFRPDAAPLVAGTPGPYKLKTSDLQALVEVLDRASPAVSRPGINMPADTWVGFVEAARGHISRYHESPQPSEGDLLARAIAFSLMARERDETISERRAAAKVESSEDQGEDDDPFNIDRDIAPAPLPSPHDEDVIMYDGSEEEGFIVSSPDDEPGVEQSQGVAKSPE